MRTVILSLVLSLAATTSLTACGSKRGEKPRSGTLIERVGNAEGLDRVVEDFAGQLAADDAWSSRLEGVDLTAFRTNFRNQLCAQIGGDCDFGGHSMLAEVGLSEDEYDGFVELFVISMNNTQLPSKEQNDLIDALYALKPAVVREGAEADGAKAGEAESPAGEAPTAPAAVDGTEAGAAVDEGTDA